MAGEERNKPGKHILLVTGGQRSGKSDFAQNRALEMSKHPVYLATSRIWDEEFRQRVLRHQANRGSECPPRRLFYFCNKRIGIGRCFSG